MRVITILLCSVFISGCGLAQKKEPTPAAPNVKSELSKVEIDIRSGATKRAIKRLENIIQHHAQTDAADDAHIALGQIYYDQGQYNESYKNFISVIDSEFFSPREVEAALGAARALHKLGRYDEALSLTQRSLRYKSISPATLNDIHFLRYTIQSQLGDRIEALKSLIYLTESAPQAQAREKYRIKANELVESNLSDDELHAVARDSSFGFVRVQALYRVATTFFEQRDYSRAESFFRDVLQIAPNTDIAQHAQNYISQIEARRRVSPLTIGAVLPLSGRHSAIAQKTLRGLQMGLGIYGRSPSDFKIAVIDSEANPDVARRAVERLVVEDSVIAIVGDVLSKTSETVAQKADELGVPVIGLSQKSGLTQIGENVFRNALTSEALVQQLVSRAINDYGHRRFAIIYPNDPYGVEYANIFWNEVLSRGGQITAAQTYSPQERDFSGVISRLVGTFYLEDRHSEYSALLGNWYAEQKVISSRVTPPADLLAPIVDFDAVFIPDGAKALGQIASMLVYHDVKNVRLLGTNLWNSPAIVSRGTSLIEGSLFVDARSTVDKSFSRSAFFREYKSLYGEEPSVFEAQAYDTALSLRTAIQSGARSRPALRESLLRTRTLQGAVGTIDVTESREFTRPLSLLTVKDGQIEIAVPPPSTPTF